MVSGVSSFPTNAVALPATAPQVRNAADISSGARAYLASRDNDSDTTMGSPQAGASRDPAVLISLSADALRLLQQTRDSMDQVFVDGKEQAVNSLDATDQDELPFFNGPDRQYFDDMHASMEMRRQIAELNLTIKPHELDRQQLADHQAAYNYFLNTKPVPAEELTGKERDAALKLLSDHSYARPGADHTVSFVVNNLTYMFKGDGSVWTNDGRVPTSEAAKQGVHATLRQSISYGQEDVSASIAQRDALQAQVDAIMAKYAPKSSG